MGSASGVVLAELPSPRRRRRSAKPPWMRQDIESKDRFLSPPLLQTARMENSARNWCNRPTVSSMRHTLQQRVLDNLSTAIVLVDAELRLLALNQAAEDLFSVSARQSLDLPLARLVGDLSALTGVVRRALASGQQLTERDMEITMPGGRLGIVDCTVTPLLEGEPAAEALIELSGLDRHHRILRDGSLSTQHQVMTTLVRSMAHEVKNPLGGIRGAAQLLDRELEDPALREYTRIIIQECDRLRKLMDRMLGPPSVAYRSYVNIHEVTEQVRALLGAEAPGTVELVRDYDPSLPPVFADRDQLVQAVLNIARNSVQALAERPGQVLFRTRAQRKFTVGATLHRLVVRLEIIDNGPGIPPEIEENMFLPLVTGRAEGTGLGLSIAQSLVHRQGGLIASSSQPGCTIFTLWLPTEDVQ